ncbi:hypothetical protein LJC14_04690 [Treponema sp. OttesenSCG-928-L16]|nr:hypothetical protein [Treponema sp. OttesenSCG-928-L16]
MKCLCGYDDATLSVTFYEYQIDNRHLLDEMFGEDQAEPRHYNLFVCPKCGTVKMASPDELSCAREDH